MTMQQQWEQYLSQFRNPPPSAIARRMARDFFYCGAAAMFQSLTEAVGDPSLSADEALARMTALRDELDAYGKQHEQTQGKAS
jgi:hypothetical protein